MIDLERKFSATLDRERGMRRFSTEELLGIISPAEGALSVAAGGEEEARGMWRSYGTTESEFRKKKSPNCTKTTRMSFRGGSH